MLSAAAGVEVIISFIPILSFLYNEIKFIRKKGSAWQISIIIIKRVKRIKMNTLKRKDLDLAGVTLIVMEGFVR